MRVHVTGELGFVGRHLLRRLLAYGYEPTMLVEYADLVIHAGARVGRERCARNKAEAIDRNVTATVALAEACAEAGTRLLYVSSAEAESPSNLYALTKRWGEDACRLVLPPELLSIARLGALYGPGARLGADTLTNFFVAAMEGSDLGVYRDTWRSWTYVEDAARALVLIAEASERWREHGKHSLAPALYNVDSGDRRALVEVARAVIELVGGESELYEVAAPAGYAELPLASTTRLRALGWEPRVTFAEGLELTYARLRESLLAAA